MATRTELVAAISGRYVLAGRPEKTKILDEFEALVCPRINPVLSPYFEKLTGIGSEKVARQGSDFAQTVGRCSYTVGSQTQSVDVGGAEIRLGCAGDIVRVGGENFRGPLFESVGGVRFGKIAL